jgi:ubiquinol-cytochrome c reductase iron-sulfur subunit
VLVRVQEGEERPLPGRENWSPEGILGYSKLCTHAGCPVGLY